MTLLDVIGVLNGSLQGPLITAVLTIAAVVTAAVVVYVALHATSRRRR